MTDREIMLTASVTILEDSLEAANRTIKRDRATFTRLWDIICRLSEAGRDVGHGGPISTKEIPCQSS